MIVGLHGKMGAGKNEAARRLALLSPIRVVEVSYAAKLKQSAAALLGCSVDDLERWKNDPAVTVEVFDDDWQECKQTVRSFLQRYGTESHRDVFGEDFWVDAAMPLDRDYSDALYVVTDVRFANEKRRIEDLGGIVVRIVGPTEETGSHVSEVGLDCDIVIDNRTRDDGYAALDRHLAALLEVAHETPDETVERLHALRQAA